MQLSGLNKEKVYAEVSLSVHFLRKNSKGRAECWVQMGRVAWHRVAHGTSATDSSQHSFQKGL